MSVLKRTLAIILCLTALICFTALAEDEPLPTPQNTVTLSLNDADVTVGDEGVVLTVTIDNLASTLASVENLVISIDSDLVEVTDAAGVAGDNTIDYTVPYTVETPTTEAVTIDIPLTVTSDDLAVSPKTVNISVASITLKDNSEPALDIVPEIGEPVALTLQNEVINAKLTFDSAISNTTDITVAYQLQVTEPDPIPDPIPATLTLKNEGKTIKVTTEAPLAEGTYKVLVTANGYLVPSFDDVVIDSEHTEPVFSKKLTPGDLNGDTAIDIYDFHEICSAVEAQSEDTLYDLNKDGNINKRDVNLMVSGWTAVYGQ